MKKYRVVRDDWSGFEVQEKSWWWPFWVQSRRGGAYANTHKTLEAAKDFIASKKRNEDSFVVYKDYENEI